MEQRAKDVQLGRRTRKSFSKIREVIDMPNLIEVQKNSYKRFVEEGFWEVLKDASPIVDHSGKLRLEFVGYSVDFDHPKYGVEECKSRDATYSAPLRIKVRLIKTDTGEIKEQDVFITEFPIMTDWGTFIYNGAERVIVSQLVRSPGAYYSVATDLKTGKQLYSSQVIPNRGAWLEYETDSNEVLYVKIDRQRKMCLTTLIRALGISSNEDIIEFFGEEDRLTHTLARDTVKNSDEALKEIYKRLRPGEPPTVEGAQNHIYGLYFDSKRYDLARVGRYKFNKKLSLASRISGRTAGETVIDETTGEILVSDGEYISSEIALAIENAGVLGVYVRTNENIRIKVVGNHFVDPKHFLSFDPKLAGLNEKVYYPALKEILDQAAEADLDEKGIIALLLENVNVLIPRHIVHSDIFASISYLLGMPYGLGKIDDIDHLGNRRIRSVGELLQGHIRVGLARLEKNVRDRMSQQDTDTATPSNLINTRPISAVIKEFFGSSQLSQFMDQTNPLAELANKRRLSALGQGGLNRDRATFEVRDVHYSHYGRMCPIETPEGPNIGLINSLSTYARINEYGFVEAPYRRVDAKNKRIFNNSQDVVYLTADEEDGYIIAQANEPLIQNDDGTFWFEHSRVVARRLDEIIEVPTTEIDYMDVSPKQLVSVATAMIPFLENDDANRALMGSNMQRQAVPLLRPEAPFVGTGMEYKAARDSGVVVIAHESGIVKRVTASRIVIMDDNGEDHIYNLTKFTRSNQGTCINQHPLVNKGDRVNTGDIIADGASTEHGEMALGRNILIGFMTWEGYNYEDAVLISEELVRDDVYTSIHIEKHELEARDTKLGKEDITRDIPNVGAEALKDLDERGIIRIGAEVRPGDILVGKVTPKGETELTAEEKLLRAIFGEKAREVRDTSLRVPHGEGGIVVDVKLFTRDNKDELAPGVNEIVRVYIAQKRKISVGDKMAGRHGNKGVVSRVLPVEDMPFLPDGTPLQIVLNPLGVPSRMNIGQILELHLGKAAKNLGWHIATPVFDGATQEDIAMLIAFSDKSNKPAQDLLKNYSVEIANAREKYDIDSDIYGLLAYAQDMEALGDDSIMRSIKELCDKADGKTILYDGRTGEPFDNRISVGYMYYLKLHHLVDDKIHARSTGPYSLVTQQPLGGKAQFGGQRFGEMEVWALEAYGAANTLQEILTIKSDDIVGRSKAYEAIVKGNNVPEPGVPESFKVLIRELQSLALDIKVLSDTREELEIGEDIDYSDATSLDVNMAGLEGIPDTARSYEQASDNFSLFDDDEDIDDDVGEFEGFSFVDGDEEQ
ncbi:MAG: DNA-directed RNA polymerase subunit beta [Clostridia bacterium]|nr:DNA-directed RNA polymerase subunit beta [Clostridia bacterium]